MISCKVVSEPSAHRTATGKHRREVNAPRARRCVQFKLDGLEIGIGYPENIGLRRGVRARHEPRGLRTLLSQPRAFIVSSRAYWPLNGASRRSSPVHTDGSYRRYEGKGQHRGDDHVGAFRPGLQGRPLYVAPPPQRGRTHPSRPGANQPRGFRGLGGADLARRRFCGERGRIRRCHHLRSAHGDGV